MKPHAGLVSLVALSLTFEALGDVPDRFRLHRFDGGLEGDLRRLPDGGARIERIDGGNRDLTTAHARTCYADAGPLVRLLLERHCGKSDDCRLVRPELPVVGVGCCYAVNRQVAESKELD